MYRKDWNLNVIELPDGGNRVCVIEIQSERPLLVISAYLPSRKYGRSSLTNEKDHHYFLNRFVCVGEFFDG